MTAATDIIRGRSNVVTLTNNSGGALVAGDVCVQDTSADEKATTTTSAASALKVFIAAESIANGAAGKFYSSGYCPLVTPSASVTRGRYLFTHTVAKQAAENATYGAGAFGVILTSGTTPSVWLFGSTAQGTGAGTIGGSSGSTDNAIIRADGTGGSTIQSSLATIDDTGTVNIPTGQTYNINGSPHTHAGGGVSRSGSTVDAHMAVWNGADADSIKDGGAVALGMVGWLPWVAHYGFNHNSTVNTTVTLAAVSAGLGGAIASPIFVPAYAKLDTLTIRSNDSSGTREAEYRLYIDSGNDNNTLNEVANSNGTFSFTGNGANNKTSQLATVPLTLAPGIYWLVVRNTSSSNTFAIQVQSVGTMTGMTGYQTKSIAALGSTLDFVAATWTKSANILAAQFSCRIFGQTSLY